MEIKAKGRGSGIKKWCVLDPGEGWVSRRERREETASDIFWRTLLRGGIGDH